MTTIHSDALRFPPALLSSSWGASEEWREVEQSMSEARLSARAAATALQSQTYTHLERVFRESSEDNWDGYGAKAISAATRDRVRAFLDCLPLWMPVPDIVPEADGELAIEWNLAPDRIFSVSLGESGPAHFAGRFGRHKERHGVEAFDGEISEEILYYINQLFGGVGARYAA